MERITFLIERTHLRLTCLLNPEDRDEALTMQRSSGLTRDEGGSQIGSKLSDSPVQARGRGDTRLTLKLLFDIALTQPPFSTNDVRDLTRPLWELTEYAPDNSSAPPGVRGGTSPLRGQANRALPQVRVMWGKGWEIPAVVESVAERYERFSEDGLPQRSWMTLRLLRVSDEIPPAELPSRFLSQTLPAVEDLAGGGLTALQPDIHWGTHVKLGDGTQGDQLWQLAARYLGDSRLWRWIAIPNNIADPHNIKAGTVLRIPPLDVLAARLRGGQPK